MSNLIEVDRWENGIYQLETSDPVIGGPDGIDNLQAKQLANRTQFLKRSLEAGQSNLEAHANAVDPHPQYATKADLAQRLAELVGQSPAALDTLRELADALGNDPNFATTVTNELAKKAAIESPVFTGAPKAPTPVQFDNGTKLATMAALMRDRFGFSGFMYYNGSAALPPAVLGSVIDCAVGAGPYTLMLPALAASMAGSAIKFVSYSPSAVTISTGSAVKIWLGVNGGNSGTAITLQNGDSATLITDGYGWFVIDGSVLLPATALFGSSLAPSGYQKLPGGLIIQWGAIGNVTTSATTANFPLAFQLAVYSVSLTATSNSAVAATLVSASTTAISAVVSSGNVAVGYVAIGK
ncbi:hypothetical protein WJ32_10130 [Burkholderia ubonensis]|uniref:Putative tail fiber protein gp53-like C-terminal domain-containing protein n=1 Tax=Burkholderia ubonensis TaxID=101571 RepID=A0A103RHK6_9BURK|nr:hypothetical protein [Burkholderia ubonensis]AOJ62779.1 hypothetical protein WJ32_10130 [Burkholderia ubonensis]KVG67961.1 hypothetical protein WJ33_24205 [Burkholderia ubonensis]